MVAVADIVAALDEFAPCGLAESWDNVGLLVGDPAAGCRRVLTTLDLTAAVLDEAAALACELIVCFHPPLFRPLTRLRADEPAGALVWRAIREGRALAATHTALDAASPGTSDFLAAALGLTVTGPLEPRRQGLLKLLVTVPPAAAGAVAAALAEAGAGRLGEYAECSFRAPGTGAFRPLAGARPTVGEVGQLTEVDEVRLEMLVPRERLGAAVAALGRAHPYETVAYDLVPLENVSERLGLGRLAVTAAPERLGEFARRVGAACGATCLRWVGAAERPIRRVALLGGSGASYLGAAAAAGAEVLVTGDVKHHDALLADRLGLGLVDPGHGATEWFAVVETARYLSERLPELTVTVSATGGEPFQV